MSGPAEACFSLLVPIESIVSIIIPTCNEAGCIPARLERLAQVQSHVEVIVADGGSPDATAALVEAMEVYVSDRGWRVQPVAQALRTLCENPPEVGGSAEGQGNASRRDDRALCPSCLASKTLGRRQA